MKPLPSRRPFFAVVFVVVLLLSVSSMGLASSLLTAVTPDDALLNQLSQETGGNLRVSLHQATGKVRFLGTLPSKAIAQTAVATPEAAARAFLATYGRLFGLEDAEKDLLTLRTNTLGDGRSFTRFQQLYQGVPVIGAELIVQTNDQQGIISANGELLPAINLAVKPALDAAAARQIALAKVAKDYGLAANQLLLSEPELAVYNPIILGGPGLRLSSLVWQMEVTAVEALPIRDFVLIDAHTGAIALQFNQIADAKNRIHYDNNNNPSLGLPGNGPVRSEGQGPTGIADIDLAYQYAGNTYDFYASEHGRDSLDGNGMALISTTRYCPSPAACPYANAFWNGQQMVYGSGFSAADDVVAHELTHGVTEFSSNLFYWFQAGAINESLSDVWGEFIDLTNGAGNDAASVRWKLGEDVPGFGAIRDLRDPTVFGDPDRIRSSLYKCEQTALSESNHDNGGVHSNSGVNNKAAYLMTDGGSFNGFTVAPLGIAKVADLYYEAQTNLLTSASDYASLYDALVQASINLGFSSAERQAVKNALDAVEMSQNPVSCPASEAPVCPSGQSVVNIFYDTFESGFSNWQTAGSPIWQAGAFYATSGTTHLYGQDAASVTDGSAFLTNNVNLPANAYLHFKHAHGFESNGAGTVAFDGGVVEYSSNNGSSWNDAGSLFTHNGYNATLASATNPLNGRSAYGADSFGYISSRLNLNSLAGQNVRFRFRIGSDNNVFDYGWFIDDVRIYTCHSGGPKDEFGFLPLVQKAPLPTPPPTPTPTSTGNLEVDNQTGGALRIELQGFGAHDFPTGTTTWTNITPGTYNAHITSLSGPCEGSTLDRVYTIPANGTLPLIFTCSLLTAEEGGPVLVTTADS